MRSMVEGGAEMDSPLRQRVALPPPRPGEDLELQLFPRCCISTA